MSLPSSLPGSGRLASLVVLGPLDLDSVDLASLDFSDIRTTFPAPACTKPADLLDVYDGDVVYDFGVGEEKALR